MGVRRLLAQGNQSGVAAVSSKRTLRRRACAGKRRYTREEARAAVAAKPFLVIYPCGFCGPGAYHVGHPMHHPAARGAESVRRRGGAAGALRFATGAVCAVPGCGRQAVEYGALCTPCWLYASGSKTAAAVKRTRSATPEQVARLVARAAAQRARYEGVPA